METLWQDIRYGVRMLWRSPAFTVVAALSLALGIGANTTIFTLVNAVFLQPLPVTEPARLMAVYGTDERNTGNLLNFMPISYQNYQDYREQNEVFSDLVAFMGAGLSLSGAGEPAQLNGLLVTGNYFDALGVRPTVGRAFSAEEDATPGAHPVVVLSHGLWQRQFGGDPALVGRTIMLNNQSFTVIGIAPENFRGTFAIGATDVWMPLAMRGQVLTGPLREWADSRRALLYNVIGRLKPGVTMEQAQAAMQTIGRRLEQEHPRDNEKRNVLLRSLAESTINPNQREVFVRAGGLMTTVVGLVLLIACANVANLLLARARARRKEMAIRSAIGAGRMRIVRQLLTESILLALIGGALGLLVAYWGRELLWAFRPPFFGDNALDLSLNGRILGFTVLLSCLTGIIFGLAPALQASRPDLVNELKDKSNQPGHSQRRFNLLNILVVAQVALSLVALIGAGLFLRSLQNAQQLSPGFETEKLLIMSFNVAAQGYDEARGLEFYRQVQERVESVPGVVSAAVATNPPFAGGLLRSVTVEGQEPAPGGRGILTLTNNVGTKYLETLGIPLQRGRNFTEADRAQAAQVAIINETAARRFWPERDPVGQRFRFFGIDAPYEVVGVARDSDSIALGEDPNALIYVPLAQNFAPNVTLHVRTAGDPTTVLGTVRREVQALDPNLPLVGVSTITEVLAQALWAARMGAALLGIFGLLALVLAAIGIYGVLAYSVSQRTHEIGLRMALGAQAGDVLKLVIKQGMVMVAVGIGIGLIAGFAATRLVANLLFGVAATDPITFIGTVILLSVVALVASYIPARRASRVDPMIALRYE